MSGFNTLLHERYELRSILGRGGQATVFRAFDRTLKVERAIKLLSKELMRNNEARVRFEAEAQVMAQLRHPSIVRLYDIISTDELLFLVMDIVDGGNIWEWVRTHGPMPEKMACMAMLDIVDAVGSLHRAGVIHRDIKPSNLLLHSQGKLLITDFGIARFDRPEEQQTQTGMVMGTYGYMAPEQLASARLVTPQSDVYALGASIFALCTASIPKDLFMVKHKPEMISVLSPPLRKLIMSACDYDKEHRYQSSDALRKAIEVIIPLLPEVPTGTVSLQQQALEVSKKPEKQLQKEELLSITWKKQIDPTFVFDTSLDDTQRTQTDWYSSSDTILNDEHPSKEEFPKNKGRMYIGIAISSLLLIAGVWFASNPHRKIPDVKETCLQLGKQLLSRQKEDGGFSGIVQAGSSMWDSGQQFHALQWASACGLESKEHVQKVDAYLSDKSAPRHAIDVAWASLAILDAETRQESLQTLSSYRLENGMFSFQKEDDVGDWYTTLLSLWAQSEGDVLSSKQNKQTLDILLNKMEGNWWPGLDEQLMWIRLYSAPQNPELAPSAVELNALMDRLLKRCVYQNEQCTAIRWPDTQLESSKNRFTLSFHGRPWAIALLSLLRDQKTFNEDPRIEVMFHWLMEREYQSRSELMGNENYRISEHVFALGFYESLKNKDR